jgi:large subunit ribosomal protein L10
MDGKTLSVAEITQLADLESREVLLAKLAGAMKASLSQAAALFNAPLAQAARTLEALRVKAEADPSVIGGAGAPAPAAEAPVVEEAPAAESDTEAVVETEEAAPAADEVTEAVAETAPEGVVEAAEDGETTEG